jgi:hypothetical protein
MNRDDLVKQLERAEQRQAATRGHHISIFSPATEAVFRASEALQIWDMAYAAGFTNRDYLLAALKKLRNESHTIQGASDDYKQGREMGIQLCINELTRGKE